MNMPNVSYGGVGGAVYTNGIVMTAGSSPHPQTPPKSLIATRAVQTKLGWVGQLIVDEGIIWESEPVEDKDEDGTKPEKVAERLATERVIRAFVKMLTAE